MQNNSQLAAEVQLRFASYNDEVPFERNTFRNKNDSSQKMVAYHLLMPQEDKTRYYIEANLAKPNVFVPNW